MTIRPIYICTPEYLIERAFFQEGSNSCIHLQARERSSTFSITVRVKLVYKLYYMNYAGDYQLNIHSPANRKRNAFSSPSHSLSLSLQAEPKAKYQILID
jgi:hypothetical protein